MSIKVIDQILVLVFINYERHQLSYQINKQNLNNPTTCSKQLSYYSYGQRYFDIIHTKFRHCSLNNDLYRKIHYRLSKLYMWTFSICACII